MGGETWVVSPTVLNYCAVVEAVLGEDLLRLVGVLQPFVELLRGFEEEAGLAQRCGYSLRSTSVSSTGAEVDARFFWLRRGRWCV